MPEQVTVRIFQDPAQGPGLPSAPVRPAPSRGAVAAMISREAFIHYRQLLALAKKSGKDLEFVQHKFL